MKVTKTTIFLLTVLLFSGTVSVQSQNNTLGVGFNVSQYQKDFGIGIQLTSPYFANSRMAVRLGANLQWFEYFNGTETTWSPYANFQFGIRSRQFVIADKLSIYGEGGAVLLLPNSDFSSDNSSFGGYGLFGFEFYAAPNFSYYIELGGVGTGAVADRVAEKPIYSNGFLTNAGFRVNF